MVESKTFAFKINQTNTKMNIKKKYFHLKQTQMVEEFVRIN